MAAALECWSGRPSTDEDPVEQILIKTHHRSESLSPLPSSSPGSTPPTKWHRLGRNLATAISALKNTLNFDSSAFPRAETKLSPAKLFTDIRRHFDSLPHSYSQSSFDMKDIILHIRLVDQVAAEDLPAFQIQRINSKESVFKLTFVCNSSFSWPTMSSEIDGFVLCYRKIQIFEKRGLVLGVVTVVIHPSGEKQFKSRVDSALRFASRKHRSPGGKLAFGLCGCQEEGSRAIDYESQFGVDNLGGIEILQRTHLTNPLPESSLVVSIDELQTIRSGGEELGRWILGTDEMEFVEKVGGSSFTGCYKGKKVWIKRFKGCERGNAYEMEIRQDLMQLMNCGQKNLLQFCGICIHESNGLCVVTELMEGGSVHDLIERNKQVKFGEVMRIALDVAEGLVFMNSHGVPYRDLNRQRILLDLHGNACLGDMGVVSSCMSGGEVTEYETAGYRWLAPEIIAGDPESVTETSMSNVYSFGMVLWEMVTGEAAFSSYSPVQAAVGIAACGLRPDIPKDCPAVLRSLMIKCWNSCPSKRPQLSEIVTILLKQNIT